MADIKIKILQEDGTYYEIDKYNGLQSLTSLSQSTTDAKQINYGVTPSSGSIEILDKNDILINKIINGTITNNKTKLYMYINGTQFREYIISNSEYSEEEKIVKLELSDKLETYKKINTKYYYTGFGSYDTGYYETFYHMMHNINEEGVIDKIKTELGLTYSTLIDYVNNLFKNSMIISEYGSLSSPTYFPYEENRIDGIFERICVNDGSFYSKVDTYYNFLDKVCKATQLNLIQEDDGGVSFISSRCRKRSSEKVIIIPKRIQINSSGIDVLLKNKYNKVKYNKKGVKTSFNVALEKKTKMQDKSGNLILDNLEGGQILQSGDIKFLCFFTTIESNSVIIPNTKYSVDNVYAYSLGRKKGGVSWEGSESVYLVPNSSLKEDYDFSSHIGSLVLLDKYTTDKSFTIASSEQITFSSAETADNLEEITVITRPRGILEDIQIEYFGSGDNILEYEYENEFLGDNIKFYVDTSHSYSMPMYTCIFNNIINDYSNGIRTLELEIFAKDMYNTAGTLEKDFSQGQIIKVGDIVRVDDSENQSKYKNSDNTDMYFKVVGREVNYSGQITMKLQLQECKY